MKAVTIPFSCLSPLYIIQYGPVMPVNLAPIRHRSGFNGMEIHGAQAFPAEQII